MSTLDRIVTQPTDVTSVVSLSKGDFYKRLEPKKDYSEAKIHYGVVADIISNGEAIAIQATEFLVGYSGVTIAEKIYQGDSDLQLFPASVEEITEYLPSIQAAADDDVRKARGELIKATSKQRAIIALVERIFPTEDDDEDDAK